MFIMLSNYKGKIEELNYKYLPYVLIAPIILQIYSIVVRISNYGVTSSRYIGIFIIIFELVALFLYLFKKKKYIKYNFIVMPIFTLILFVLPLVNLYEAPIELQVMRLESIWKEDTYESDITKSDRQKIKDIYEFLNDYDNADKYLPKYLKMEKINKYLMDTKGEFEGIEQRYFSFTAKEGKIDISSYNNLEPVVYQGNSIPIDYIKINIGGVDYNIKENLKEYMKNDEVDNIVIDNGEGAALYISNMSFYFNDSEGNIENYIIEGYLLTR